VREAAAAIPVIFSPNMSLGVNVLFELARTAAQRLGLGYDVEVVESHHKQKKDAPSGTAKRLAEVLADARRQPPSQIPVHAVRAGDIVGDHTVILAGPAERLELTHRAQSRDVFAAGALRAAQCAAAQKPGLYDMSDVLKHAAGDT
jgi:4-hydroxy-tetrahydrodipicolinate reductase